MFPAPNLLHQLPLTPDTLWLRLLGKGQCQAIREVLALPQTTPYRDRALQLLANWKIALETLNPPPSEEEETLMALSQAYLEWEQKTIRLGEERGRRLGEVRGMCLGEERGMRLGEEQGEQRERRRLVLEMLEMEVVFKFGDRGRSLLPYLQAVDNTALLYDFLRSLKPLSTWEEVRSWWFDRLGPGEIETVSDDAAVAVAVKLRFPDAEAAAIAQATTQLGATGLDWSVLRLQLEAAAEIGAIGEVEG
ncbi:MAG: hypothetical protein ACO331_01990 [Prochlorothrix sp.]